MTPSTPQQSFYFKLRSMIPCCLCHLNFTVAVPEEELIQVGRSRPFWKEMNVQYFINIHFFFLSRYIVTQVAVTAVAMTFDKDQTQEKPSEKPASKGLQIDSFVFCTNGLGPQNELFFLIQFENKVHISWLKVT